MERLTIPEIDYSAVGVVEEMRTGTIAGMLCRLAYYEDLEEQGRLLVLPCKVGDVVYELDRRILQVFRIIPPSAAFIMSEIENGIEFYKTRDDAEKALEGVSEDA